MTITKIPFSYSDLAPDIASELRQSADTTHSSRGRPIEGVLAIGKALLKAYSRAMNYGQFREWIASELNFSERSAWNYMYAFEAFGSNPQRVAGLQMTDVFKLARLPAELRERVLAAARTDERTIGALIAKEVYDAKAAAAEAAEKERVRLDAKQRRCVRELKKLERKEAAYLEEFREHLRKLDDASFAVVSLILRLPSHLITQAVLAEQHIRSPAEEDHLGARS